MAEHVATRGIPGILYLLTQADVHSAVDTLASDPSWRAPQAGGVPNGPQEALIREVCVRGAFPQSLKTGSIVKQWLYFLIICVNKAQSSDALQAHTP